MKFVVDMNLSPEWVRELAADGHDAVHWRDVGGENAPDHEIMAWAAKADRVVLTSDLGFAETVAVRRLNAPTIVQLRLGNTDPLDSAARVKDELRTAAGKLWGGAILTIDPVGVRFRPGATT